MARGGFKRVADVTPAADWQPVARPSVLRARARLYASVRRFFADAGVLEVETPIASSAAASDPAIESLQTAWAGNRGVPEPLWLHTSPELPMKRLLAGGSGPIYQIAKVFRGGERGRAHHPEFSLLEWYRPGWGYGRLMEEVADLIRAAADCSALPVESFTYRELFQALLGIDPWSSDERDLRRAALRAGVEGIEGLVLDRDGWLDLLLTRRIEPELGRGRLTFVRDYPPSQAALARIRPGDQPVAERFELYLGGLELANGFTELTDAAEQRRRFARDLDRRSALGLASVPLDERFLAALEAGMPETSGVALGLDRLLMYLTGSSRIDQVLAFPVERA
jgi:lysyl-tRNA synthetase class 2